LRDPGFEAGQGRAHTQVICTNKFKYGQLN
jgi:hypothetical protein